MITRVLFVCHGNICRSTMAQCVFIHLCKQKGVLNLFYIESAATSREEIGNPPHRGTVQKLHKEGIQVIPHQATQMTKEDYDKYDLLIGMDSMNMRNMQRIVGHDRENKMHLLTEYSGKGGSIADPWYTGNFDVTYEDVLAGCEGLLECLLSSQV